MEVKGRDSYFPFAFSWLIVAQQRRQQQQQQQQRGEGERGRTGKKTRWRTGRNVESKKKKRPSRRNRRGKGGVEEVEVEVEETHPHPAHVSQISLVPHRILDHLVEQEAERHQPPQEAKLFNLYCSTSTNTCRKTHRVKY